MYILIFLYFFKWRFYFVVKIEEERYFNFYIIVRNREK